MLLVTPTRRRALTRLAEPLPLRIARALREEVTVTVVPRVNPDGFARWEREVGGERGLTVPRALQR